MKPQFKVNVKKRKKKAAKKLMKLLIKQPEFVYMMPIKWVSLEEIRKLYGRQQ